MPRLRVALAVAALALAGCTAPAPATSPPAPSAAPPSLRPPVAVVVDGDIWTTDGNRIPVGWAGESASVARIPAGWLVINNYAPPGGWLVDDGGAHRQLWSGARWPVLSADGTRLAYRHGDEIVIASVTAGSLTTVASTAGVGAFHPLRFLGNDVLLGSTETGGGIETYDMWYPARGQYQATPAHPAMDVMASTSDGRLIAGLIGDGACLAVVDPNGFTVVRKVCQLGPHFGPQNPVSPDGRWLLAGLDKTGSEIVAVDLTTVFDRPELTGVWADRSSYKTDIFSCVWADPATALCGAQGGLVRLRMDQPGAAELVPIAPGPVVPVRQYGA